MSVRILVGDVRERLLDLPDQSVHMVVTSPPYYGLRCYGVAEQIGLEETPDEYIAALVDVFRAVRRVLRPDGVMWVNMGDSYAGYWGEKYAHKPFGKDRTPDESTPPHKKSPDWAVWGVKPKDLMMMPARLALALQADGWWLRSDIIWAKPNPMPESVTDRPTSAHEHIFLLAKSARYHFDADAVRQPLAAASIERLSQDVEQQLGSLRANGGAKRNGPMKAVTRKTDKQRGHGRRHAGFNDRWDQMTKAEQQAAGANIRNVWTIATAPFADAHFATFPPALVEPCIKAGCPGGGVVLDPFGGSGTTGVVADRLGRDAILIELNPEYAEMARGRIEEDAGMFGEVSAA